MIAHLLTVGDELLIGQVVNSNAAWLGEQLTLAGVDVRETVTVGDEQGVIETALARAWEAADLVVVTGGLGPTHDDLTREAVAGFFGVPLVFHQDVFDHVRRLFDRFGRTMPESNRSQAMAPLGFEVLHNPVGTAPGLWFAGAHRGRTGMLFVAPGVPREMKRLVGDHLLPRLALTGRLRAIRHHTLYTLGIGESHLQEKIADLVATLHENLRLAYLPDLGSVRLRVTAFAPDVDTAEREVQVFAGRLRERLGTYIVGRDDEPLEVAIGRLLNEAGRTVATAESCTGGLVGDRITNVSGSSDYFLGGVIAYSNDVKQRVLGVSEEVLRDEGAVSELVAMQMAEGVRRVLGADIGLSSTGIMGPGGGTADKPVGTVWIGYADASGAEAHLVDTRRDRLLNKQAASLAVLDLLRKKLIGA